MKTCKNRGFASLAVLITLAASAFFVAEGNYLLSGVKKMENSILEKMSVNEQIKNQADYLDSDKLKGASIDGDVIGTVILPDGSFSSYKVIDAELVNKDQFNGEAKIEFLSGDIGFGSVDSQIISPFYLSDGTKTTASILDRMVVGLNYAGIKSYPIKILSGQVKDGRLVGLFTAQTYASGFIISGNIDNSGKITSAEVLQGAERTSEAENLIAANALSLFQNIAEVSSPKVLAASTTNLGNYQVSGFTKPVFDKSKGTWVFAGGAGTGTVSTSQAQNIVTYTQNVVQAIQQGQIGGGTQQVGGGVPASLYQYLPAITNNYITGLKEIKSATSNLSISTVDGISTLSITFPTSTTTTITTTSGLGVSNFSSANISQWTNDAGYITSSLIPNQTGNNGRVLGTNGSNLAWITNSSGVAWGAITGTIADQADLQNLLISKADKSSLNALSSQSSGDISNLQIELDTNVANLQTAINAKADKASLGTIASQDANDVSITGGSISSTVISGLSPTNFTSSNISQWTNDSGYITGLSWGGITGSLSDQTDLITALNAKADSSSLGTAAYTAASAYATAAQGTLATNALSLASFTDTAVSGKLITGYVSGAGTVTATDTILSAIQKLNGNDATNANLTGVVTSVGNATSIANGVITNAMLANSAVANLSGTNTGDNAVNSNYASDYRAANFVAGTNYLTPTGSAANLTSFPTFNQNTTGTASNITGVLGASSFPVLTGDITTTQGSLTTTIGAGKVTNTNLFNSALTVTAGTGLTGGGTVSLGSSTTLGIDSTVSTLTGIQTLTNKTIAAGLNTISGLTTTNFSSNNISQWNNDSGYITGISWGNISGTLANQTDLQTVLNTKVNTSSIGTIASQNSNNVSITGGSLSSLTSVGATTFIGALTGNASTVTGFSPTSGKVLSISKTMTLTSADDTGVYTLPTGTATLLATNGSAANLTSFPTFNQNTTGTAAGLSVVLISTSGGSGVNNAGTLTWGAGGTLGTAAYTATSAYATAAQGTLATNALPTSSFTDAAVSGKLITGYISGAGTVVATDTILQAIQKLNGNDATNANLTGVVTSVGNATSIAAGAITNAMLANGAVANLSGTNTGDNAVNSNYASDYRAANFVAGTNYLTPTGSAANLTSFPTFNQNTTGTASNITGVLGASSFPALSGDISNTQGNLTTTIGSGAVTLGKMANLSGLSIIGNNTGSATTPIALSVSQVTTLLGLGTISTQNSNNVSITGGSLSGLISVGATTFTGALTGNASTATTLATARTIAGTSFDGSANIALANKFIVQGTSDSGLSSAQFLGSLSTGILKNTTSTGVLSIAVAGDFPTLNQNTTGTASNITGVLGASSFPALTGDITTTQGSLTTTIGANKVTLGQMATLAGNSIIGNNTGSAVTPIALSVSQITALLGLGTISTQNANNVSITGGSMSGLTSVGATTFTGALTGNASSATTATTATTGNALANTDSAGQSAITAINSATSGTINTARLNSSVTIQGNTFNGVSQLVKLDTSGNLPALNGSALTGITGDQVLPAQTGNSGKILGTNGTTVSWVANSSSVAWGAITGTLSNQTDLNTALSGKLATTLPSANIFVGNGSSVATSVAMSGDATIDNTGVITIGSAKITLAKMADMTTASFIGRNTTGSGAPEVLSATTAKSILGIGTIASQNSNSVSITGGSLSGLTSVGATTFTGALTGNASTATTLATPRTIAGTSFDGSANISLANKFIVQGTTDAGLSGAQFLGALGTGIVKNTTTTGVLSIAVAGDFPTLNQSTTGNAATATNLTGLTATISNLNTVTGALGTNAFTSTTFSPIVSPTFTGTVTIPTPFTIGAVSVTATGTQLNYLSAATGTTGTNTTNLVFSTSPTLVTPALGTPTSVILTNATGTAANLTAGLATSLAGGLGGQIPYQSAAGTTAMLTNGTAGQVLQSNGTTLAPTWVTIGGTGTVTSVSVATANGFSGTVANATTTPAITIIAGAITPTSVNGLTINTTTGILALTNGKTLTVSDSTTLATNAITFGGGEVVTFSATNALSLLTTGATSVTLPTSGTLVSSVTTGNGVSASNTAGALSFTLGAITPTTVNTVTISGSSTPTLTVTGTTTVSGSNTGDNATNSQYSGLATSKQDTLVSAINIKTINGTTILGSGDLVVSGSGARLDQITAATAIANIDSTNFGIVWNWSTLTTQTAMKWTGGTAMTTGSVFAINTATYTHGAAETGSLASLAFSDTTSAAFATTTNGLLISPTMNTTGSSARTFNGLSVTPTLTACGTTGGTCTYNSFQTTMPALTQTTTNTFNLNGLNIASAGALQQNTAAGTINWIGAALTMPTINTNTASAIITATGVSIPLGAITQLASSTATANGITITPTTFTTGGTQNMINIGNLTAPTVGSTSGLFFGTGWSDLHSSTAASNNFAGITITKSSAGANANNFTIKNNSATMFNLFELRDLTANTNNFGGLALAGGFVSQQSYFGEEFNSFRQATCGLLVSATADTHTLSRGDWGNAATASVCNTANTSNASGEISTSGVFAVAAATNGCTYASAASSTNGYERTTATTGSTASSTADCLEVIGGSATAGTNNNLFNGSNFPQVVMKWESNAFGSTQRTFMGISNLATAVANPTTAMKGAYFTNCTAPNTPTCGTTLVGAVQDGTNAANTVACPANDQQGQALTAAKWIYSRIEFRKVPAAGTAEIQFFVDYDTSNGIAETSCGTVTAPTASLAASPMTMLNMVVNSAVSLTTTHDVDYFRVWQDDSGDTSVASDLLTTPPVAVNSAPQTPFNASATLAKFLAMTGDDVTAAQTQEIDSGRIAASLEIVTPKITANSLTISGPSTLADTLFNGNVTFNFTPLFNSDTAGFAVIKQGATEVNVNFDKEYLSNPVVSASPIWDTDQATLDVMKQLGTYILPKQDYIIVNANTKGFSIVLDKPAVTDLKFSWMALAIKDAKTILSASTVAIPSSSPSATPITSPQTTMEQETPAPTGSPSATPAEILEASASASPI